MPQHTTVVPCSRNHPPYAAVRKPKIVIVGCSYAGMSATLTLTALKGGLPIPFASYGDYSHLQNVPSVQDFDITVVNERDGFFHSVGAPLAHISPAETSVMWKVYKGFSELSRPDIDFVQGTVISIDPTSQLMRYQDLEGRSQHLKYDYILISSGLRRPWPIVPRSRHFRSYLSDASTFIEKIIEAEARRSGRRRWYVEMESAIGVEFAGKIKTHYTGTPVTLVHSRHQLLSNEPLPEEFKTRTLELLRAQGIDVILNQRADVQELPDGTFYVKFQDGNGLPHPFIAILAILHSHLQIISRDEVIPRMFAAGDIVNVPGIKLGGNAMLMGSVAAANIYSLLVAQHNPSWRSAMERYVPMEPKMALSVGNSAVCYTSDDGVKYGKEWVEPMFGSDLGWSKILSTLGLNNYENTAL
ncbi:disulfide oxidoreductase [Aspergillus flavus]|nr:disulfide oxidoreductase [Aspergillus flavus]